jgi:hypothetical protein
MQGEAFVSIVGLCCAARCKKRLLLVLVCATVIAGVADGVSQSDFKFEWFLFAHLLLIFLVGAVFLVVASFMDRTVTRALMGTFTLWFRAAKIATGTYVYVWVEIQHWNLSGGTTVSLLGAAFALIRFFVLFHDAIQLERRIKLAVLMTMVITEIMVMLSLMAREAARPASPDLCVANGWWCFDPTSVIEAMVTTCLFLIKDMWAICCRPTCLASVQSYIELEWRAADCSAGSSGNSSTKGASSAGFSATERGKGLELSRGVFVAVGRGSYR